MVLGTFDSCEPCLNDIGIRGGNPLQGDLGKGFACVNRTCDPTATSAICRQPGGTCLTTLGAPCRTHVWEFEASCLGGKYEYYRTNCEESATCEIGRASCRERV